jgi:metallo-beta-lactamase family protein
VQATFLGAAGTVTGSKTLLDHHDRRVLVDCGLFQGLKQLRLRNWDRLPFDAASLDAVVLTHAHLDHSGYLPRLLRLGYRGPIHCTPATRALCRVLLPDAGRLAEEDAAYANRHGFSRHHPALPLFTEADARAVLPRLKAVPFDTPFEPVPGWQVRFTPAGHIPGGASVRVAWDGGAVVFSGDLGRDDDLLMKPPAPPARCDTLVIESTYGDRLHDGEDALTAIAEVINTTASRGGVVLVPAFAVGRAQTILHAIQLLKGAHRIPDLPLFLDSPMAAEATRLLARHTGEHRLDDAQCRALARAVRIAETVDDSKALDRLIYPSVIVSASGMATGGRVLHHLKTYLPDPRHTVAFCGHQAAGTRGASLVGGAASVKIHGQHVPVRARVANLPMLSAHADREGLLRWAGLLAPYPPRRVFVVHGEPSAADSLRQAIEERHRWPASVAEHGQTVAL